MNRMSQWPCLLKILPPSFRGEDLEQFFLGLMSVLFLCWFVCCLFKNSFARQLMWWVLWIGVSYFIRAHMLVCFGLVNKSVDDIQICYLLLNSPYTRTSLSLAKFVTLNPQWVDKSLGRDNEKPEYLTQTDQRISYTLPCNVILNNRSCGCSLSKAVIAQTPSGHWSCLWGKINYCLFSLFSFFH